MHNFFIFNCFASVLTGQPITAAQSVHIEQSNQAKFTILRSLSLPLGHYAVVSSGPLGIRNLRQIQDIDIIVTAELWSVLAAKYGVQDKDGVRKILLHGDLIEAFCEGSFYGYPNYADAPTVLERITRAEMIEGLPFERLEYVLFFKRKMARKKDLEDIQLIERFQKARRSSNA